MKNVCRRQISDFGITLMKVVDLEKAQEFFMENDLERFQFKSNWFMKQLKLLLLAKTHLISKKFIMTCMQVGMIIDCQLAYGMVISE